MAGKQKAKTEVVGKAGKKNPDKNNGRDPVTITKTEKEYVLKAAFTFKSAVFTKWPKNAFKDKKSPMNICVLSDDPKVAEAFKSGLRNKTYNERKVVVKHVVQNKEIEGCHILFFGTDNRKIIREKLEFINNRSILTVGETDDFTKMCGMISLYKKEGKIQIHINDQAGKRSELKFNAQFLQVADDIAKKGCGE